MVEHPAKKIRFLLHTHSMTVQQLSAELQVPLEYLQEVADEQAMPTPQLLHRICALFDLHENYFGEALRMRPEDVALVSDGATPGRGAKQPGGRGVGGKSGIRRRRKIDLTELAARHQALVDCLIAKKVL